MVTTGVRAGAAVAILVLAVGCSDDQASPPEAAPQTITPSETGAPASTDDPPASVSVSASCDEAMSTAADEPDSALADPLIVDTLSACSSAAEWVSAVETHPGAMGLTEEAEVDRISVQAACYGNESTPVCADAAAQGLL